jgi:hypothetical protein
MKYRYEDIGTLGLKDIRTFGYEDIRTLGLKDIRTFGYEDIRTLGLKDLRMQVPGKRPFDTSFGLLRDRFNLKKYTSSAVPESAEADRRAHP